MTDEADIPVRSLDGVRAEIVRRSEKGINPFQGIPVDDARAVAAALESLDQDHWAALWGAAGRRREAEGDALAAKDMAAEAETAYLSAFNAFRIGRYPAAASPGQRQAYRDSLRAFHKAARSFDPPLAVVEIPFRGWTLKGYLQRPKDGERPPVVLQWGGVDGWKEDRQAATQALNRRGIATLAIDLPGTGENPVSYIAPEAEGSFAAWLDHLAGRADVDGSRVAVWGSSYGGYWAARMAHVEAARLKGAVFHGGSVHYGLQPEWLVPALTRTASNHIFGPASLLEARSRAMGLTSLAEVLAEAPRLSLIALDLIDRPSAPILGVNGKLDDQAPVDDIYLLMEHGSPKEARIYPKGGHMGRTPGMDHAIVNNMIADWLKVKLSS